MPENNSAVNIRIVTLQQPGALTAFTLERLRARLQPAPQETLSIGIPGGRSILPVISAISELPPELLARIHIQLIDERLSGERNMETLLQGGLQELLDSGRLHPDQLSGLESTERAEVIKPFDLLFVGIGEDGHFASLFPGFLSSYRQHDRVITVTNSPKPPPERVTISYAGFRELSAAADINLLFIGEGKRAALQAFLHGDNPDLLPCTFFKELKREITVITDISDVTKEQS